MFDQKNHYTNQTNDLSLACASIGMKLTTLPDYANVQIKGDYWTSLRKIGESIVFVRSSGNLRDYDIDKFNALIDDFCKDADIKEPYIQIRDLQDLKGRMPLSVLHKQRKYFTENQNRILGYISLNEPQWMKVFINHGIKYFKPKIKYYAANDYTDALKTGQSIINGSLISDNMITQSQLPQEINFQDIILKSDWVYTNPSVGFRYSIGAIPETLLFVSIESYAENVYDIDASIALLEEVIKNNNLRKIPWIITDLSSMKEGRGMKLRNHYISGVKKLNERYQNQSASLHVVGASRANVIISRLMSVFLKQSISFSDSVEAAIKQINQTLKKGGGHYLKVNGFYVSHDDLEEISNACGSLLWDGEAEELPIKISKKNPLGNFAETLELVRNDLKELRQKEKEQADKRLEESETHRLHLASMMKEIQTAKEELQRSEESQRILLDNIPTQIWFLSNDHTYGSVNKAHAHFLGVNASDVAFRNIFDLLPEERAIKLQESAKKVFKSGEKLVMEEWAADAAGNARMLHVTKTPKLRNDRSVEYVVCAAEDITERRLAEEQLRQLSRAVEQSPVSIVITDLEGKIEYVNPKFINITGYTKEEALGQNPSVLKSGHQPDCVYRELWETITRGGTWQGEFHNKKKNGELYWEIASISPITNDKGQITHFLAVKEDITQRKKTEENLRIAKELAERKEEQLQKMYFNLQTAEEETRAANHELMATTDALKENNDALENEKEKVKESEEMLRSITENAFDGIFLLHGKRYIYINKRLSEIIGNDTQQKSDKKSGFLQMLTPISKQVVKNKLNKHKPGETFSATFELQMVSKNANVKDVELGMVSVGFRKNEPLLIGIVRDITELKLAEEEARQRELLEKDVAVAKEALTFKQNFLANMSHEIRTPLTGILGMIEILHESTLNPEQYEYLKVIQQSGESLRSIVNDVLDFSKIEAGKLTLNKTQFRFSDITRRAENLFHALCKKPIHFQNTQTNDLPENILADENRITQIITNFISNAVKFTEEGMVNLHTEVLRREEKTSVVEIKISVTDSGIGISKLKQSQLFQPFSQIERTDTRQFDGTGLGLVICKELAQMHGGTIGVKSKPNEGSTFWFTFEAEEVLTEMVNMKSSTIAKNNEEKQTLRILLVEDTIVNQKVIGLMLSSMGHKISLASNGKKAIETYTPGEFDLILMDIQMPVMDGISATKILKKQNKNLPPIVGLSANAFEGDREKYMAKGLDEYITKPVKKEDFIFLLERLERQKKAL